MKFDICLEMVFTDLPYEARIAKIAEAGFDAAEFWFHDATFDGSDCSTDFPKDPAILKQACAASGVRINNFVVNAWDGSFGGSPVDAADYNKFIDRLHEVIAFGKSAGCNMAITCTGKLIDGLSRTQMRSNLEKAYTEAAKIAQKNDFLLVVEPLNTYVDHAGYYLGSSSEAAEIVRGIASPNFKLLYDVYHMQIMEGNIISNIEKNIDIIGHFHSAGVPGRNEIFAGELSYKDIIKWVAGSGYAGSFGLEYSPSYDSFESLKATKAFLADIM